MKQNQKLKRKRKRKEEKPGAHRLAKPKLVYDSGKKVVKNELGKKKKLTLRKTSKGKVITHKLGGEPLLWKIIQDLVCF